MDQGFARAIAVLCVLWGLATTAEGRDDAVYGRIKQALNQVRAIDTHDHLRGFRDLPNRVKTATGEGMTLYGIWAGSYYVWTNPLTTWEAGQTFEQWWSAARGNFENARATSFYRYMLPAFRDLYGVDFDTISEEQARQLNQRIFDNYQSDSWLLDVVKNRANIDLMLIDPYWNRLQFAREYSFSVPVLNVTNLLSASHPDRFPDVADSPYLYAQRKGLSCHTLAEYLQVIEAIFADAVEHDVVCLKSTQAYQRSLRYEPIPESKAASAFGKKPAETTSEEQAAFEDFMFWHVCKLSAKYDLPFQIHTGQARVQGSNPLLLVDAIQANPQTKFILFHGGFPWVGEAGVIAMRHKNVWIDSCWLPTLSYSMAKRAYLEWLEMIPSDRLMWGADTTTAEGIYAATEFTRQCLADALADKVLQGELREEHAVRIGRQILRDNALQLFPKLNRMLPVAERRAE